MKPLVTGGYAAVLTRMIEARQARKAAQASIYTFPGMPTTNGPWAYGIAAANLMSLYERGPQQYELAA